MKKAHPARLWVQIATGSSLKALAFDYNRFAKRNAALFKGKSGSTAEWGQTRRLLVGPFANRKAAPDWLGDYKKAEGDGFLFDSEAGETVDPIKLAWPAAPAIPRAAAAAATRTTAERTRLV